jgi:predicted kinase
VVVIFFGLIAAGKSVLASSWAAHHRCPCHNTDVGAQAVWPDHHRTPRTDQPWAAEFILPNSPILPIGRFALTPSKICVAAKKRLRRFLTVHIAESLIVAFLTETLGAIRGGAVLSICYCSEQTTRKRLRQRAEDTMAVSDGTWGIYIRQREDFSVPDDIDGAHLLHLKHRNGRSRKLLASVDTFVTEVHAAIEKKTQAEKP